MRFYKNSNNVVFITSNALKAAIFFCIFSAERAYKILILFQTFSLIKSSN